MADLSTDWRIPTKKCVSRKVMSRIDVVARSVVTEEGRQPARRARTFPLHG